MKNFSSQRKESLKIFQRFYKIHTFSFSSSCETKNIYIGEAVNQHLGFEIWACKRSLALLIFQRWRDSLLNSHTTGMNGGNMIRFHITIWKTLSFNHLFACEEIFIFIFFLEIIFSLSKYILSISSFHNLPIIP